MIQKKYRIEVACSWSWLRLPCIDPGQPDSRTPKYTVYPYTNARTDTTTTNTALNGLLFLPIDWKSCRFLFFSVVAVAVAILNSRFFCCCCSISYRYDSFRINHSIHLTIMCRNKATACTCIVHFCHHYCYCCC